MTLAYYQEGHSHFTVPFEIIREHYKIGNSLHSRVRFLSINEYLSNILSLACRQR